MEAVSEVIETVEPSEPPAPTGIRVRKVNWVKVLQILDANPGVWHLIGEFDQSVRSHINKGRYKYIDPKIYEAVTSRIPDKPRQIAELRMRRRVDQ